VNYEWDESASNVRSFGIDCLAKAIEKARLVAEENEQFGRIHCGRFSNNVF
jgi:hypothetical protein